MGLLDWLKNRNQETRPFVSAIIAAAGGGTRMGDVCPEGKQLALLGEIPVIVHSLMQFESCEGVDEILVVAREQDLVPLADHVKEAGLTKVRMIIKGGSTRQQSVYIGLSQCDSAAQLICIHDGARPFIEPERIQAVLDAAWQYGGAATGTRVKDTLKRVDENGVVLGTLDRSSIWAVQTPQAFRADEDRAAMAAAISAGRDYTDDCQLFEQLGRQVRMVEGSYHNLKLTTPEDLDFATYLLEEGEAL